MPCGSRFWKPHQIEMMVNDVIAPKVVKTKQLQRLHFLSMENWLVGGAMFTNEG